MAINKKLIHFKTKENFNKEVANGNILDNSICFILDVKEIYTHGTIYNNNKFSISTGVPTSNNNANTYGYYGTLKNLGIEGDTIYINNITVYKRLDNAPSHTVPMWCRILLVKDNQHILYAQSSTSKRWEDIAAELPITFDMCVKDQVLSANDTILIVFTTDPTSSIDSFTLVGVRTFAKSGAIISIDSANVNYNTGYAPALKIDYIPLYTSVVHNTGNETISGEKTFLNTLITKNVNINNETVITSEIDPGELKVLHNNSSKGFIVRTVNGSDDILPLEILSTNGLDSYTYTFPTKSGDVLLNSNLGDGLMITDGVVNCNSTTIKMKDNVTIEDTIKSLLNRIEILEQSIQNKSESVVENGNLNFSSGASVESSTLKLTNGKVNNNILIL